MTPTLSREKIIERIDQMKAELNVLRSMLAAPKPRRSVRKRSYRKQIDQYLQNNPL